jgi:hypothetical protein
MSSGNAKKIVFITVPGDKNAISLRERELQAAEARAHAARVSRRPTQKAVAKHEPADPSVRHESRQGFKRRTRKGRRADEDAILLKRRYHVGSAASLGQALVDPFDSAPVKGLDNYIYSILDFGRSDEEPVDIGERD